MDPVLVLYLLGSLAGIGVLAFALQRLGHGAPGALDEAAARALAAERGGPVTEEPFRAQNALLFPAKDGVVVVRAMGRHPVASLVTGADLRGVRAGEGRVTLRTRRYEEPAIPIVADEPEALRRWLAGHGVAPGGPGC